MASSQMCPFALGYRQQKQIIKHRQQAVDEYNGLFYLPYNAERGTHDYWTSVFYKLLVD